MAGQPRSKVRALASLCVGAGPTRLAPDGVLRHRALVNKILTVTAQGTIRLSAELRRVLGVENGGQVFAEATAEGLPLRPVAHLPVEIYDDARIREFDESEADLASTLAGGGRRR